MSLNKISISITIFAVIFFYSCSNEVPVNGIPQEEPEYFPNGDGTNYLYNVEEIDSIGVVQSGIRYILYDGTTNIDSIQYQNQIDSIDFDSNSSSGISYFWKTETGVFYYVDTTNFSMLIPDSLRDRTTIPTESRFLLLPLAEGNSWPVYRINIDDPQTGFGFAPLDINAFYSSRENITVNLTSGARNVSAIKVKFDMEVRQEIGQQPQRYSAFAWFVDKIGLVKSEGNNLLLDALLAGEVNFVDSTRTIIQELREYEIR